jgi:hypothetical protein
VSEVAGAFTHYVDSTHAASTDTSNPNGTAAKPRKTIPTSLAAGSVVEVRGGPYTVGTMGLAMPGTAAAPVFVKGVGKPVITGSLGTVGITGSYGVLEGVVIDKLCVRFSGHHLALRDSEVRNFSPSSNNSAIAGSANNIVILRVWAHHNGNALGTTEVDIHAVKFGTGAYNIWVLDSRIHENGGDEIQLGDASGSEPWVHHVYFGRNVGFGSRENCVDIKRARDIIISQNDCSGYISSSSSSGEAMVIHNSPDRVWIIGNKIHDSDRGISASSNVGAQPIYIVGNVIYGIKHSGTYDPNSLYAEGHGIQAWATPEFHIVNNTITGSDAGIAYAGGETSKLRIVNNVLGKLLQTTHHVAIATSGARVKWGSSSVSGASGFANCVDAPPLLDADLVPGAGSPAIGRGVLDPVYKTFSDLYGISIARDLAGSPRPLGAWDAGALEVQP